MKKAVSPLISVMLVLVFTVFIGMAISSWVFDYTKTTTTAATDSATGTKGITYCANSNVEISNVALRDVLVASNTSVSSGAVNYFDVTSISGTPMITFTGVSSSSNIDGLAGWWHFDGSPADSSGNGNTGVVVGAEYNASGKFSSQALQFDGGDYVTIADDATLDMTDVITLSAWVSPSPSGNPYAGWAYKKPVYINDSRDSWWNTSWTKRKKIIVNGSTTDLTDYQFNYTVTWVSGMNDSFKDLRFTYFNETTGAQTELSYWVEANYSQDNASVWIKANLTTGNNTVYVYYGNDGAISKGNGSAVFDYFEDFEDYSLGNLNGQGGWSGSSNIQVISTPVIHGTKGEALSSSSSYIMGTIPAQSGKFIVSYFQRHTNSGLNYVANVFSLRESGTTITSGFLFDGKKSINGVYYDTYTANVWYEYELAIDMTNDLLIYGKIDDITKVSNVALQNTGTTINEFYFGSGSNPGGTGYTDLITIRKYTPTEPTILETSSEDTILTDYQVKIDNINTSLLYGEGKIQQYCNDTRFTWLNQTSGAEEIIDFWTENCTTNGGNSSFWVEIPKIYATLSNNTVYVYYGDAEAINDSDGGATFIQWHGATNTAFLKPLIISIPFVYEAYVMQDSSTDVGWFGVGTTNSALNSGDQIDIQPVGATTLWLHAIDNSVISQYNDGVNGWVNSEWTNIKIKALSLIEIKMYGHNRDTLSHTFTDLDNIPDVLMGMKFQPHTNIATYPTPQQKWSFIRKYAPSEPAVISIGAEIPLGISKGNAYAINANTTHVIARINNQTISTTITPGWNYIALTYNRTAGGTDEMKLYINGVESKTADYSDALNTNSENLVIGNSFTGTIDEVRIYNKTLTPTEITNTYNTATLSTTTDSPKASINGYANVSYGGILSNGATETLTVDSDNFTVGTNNITIYTDAGVVDYEIKMNGLSAVVSNTGMNNVTVKNVVAFKNDGSNCLFSNSNNTFEVGDVFSVSGCPMSCDEFLTIKAYTDCTGVFGEFTGTPNGC